MMLLGWAGCVPWSFVVIPLIDTGKPVLYAVAIVGMSAIRDRLRTHRSVHSRAVRHPLPLQRIGAGGQPGRRPRWGPAAADRRNATGNLRQLGDRSDAGHPRLDQPGVHLPAARDQCGTTLHSSRMSSVGVQVLVEGDAAAVAGHHLHRAGHRVASEQQVAAAGQARVP